MSVRAVCLAGVLLAQPAVAPEPSRASLSFEQVSRMSDRIVVGTMEGASGGLVPLPDGRHIELGIKEPGTGLVFTPYRIRIADCLFDSIGSCQPGDGEVLIPGGTVYEAVEGQQRLRTWEVAGAAGAPLPPPGDEVVLFMTRRNDRFVALNDSGARLPVLRSIAPASVLLRFTSPRLLQAAGLESARPLSLPARPAQSPPDFVAAVAIERLKALIALARQVPAPTSGMRHAIPDRRDARVSRDMGDDSPRLRSGEVP